MAHHGTKIEKRELEELRVERRQQRIFELKIKGLHIDQISEALNISKRTVCRDLITMRKKEAKWLTEQNKNFDAMSYWLQRKSEIEYMIKELWVALVEQRTDRATVAKTIIELRNELDKCLRSAGIKTIIVDPEENVTDTIRIVHEHVTVAPERNSEYEY